nr:MAG TPA_asm: hypothetical protein [Caudoviricetes sp.]
MLRILLHSSFGSCLIFSISSVLSSSMGAISSPLL